VRFTVERRPGLPPLTVEADEHRVEGVSHVFRRDALVLSRPRSVVALRVPVAEVTAVRPAP
jgi:hypothetical protein